jgi:hypothetical protein
MIFVFENEKNMNGTEISKIFWFYFFAKNSGPIFYDIILIVDGLKHTLLVLLYRNIFSISDVLYCWQPFNWSLISSANEIYPKRN